MLFLSLLILYYTASAAVPKFEFQDTQNLPKITNYKLDFRIDYQNEKLNAKCVLTLENQNSQPISKIPLILYRTLKVTSITDESGKTPDYTQQVVSFADFEPYQANYIYVSLEKPLQKNEKITFDIDYEGYLLGYSETGMRYVKDKISPEFTILRPDCNAYPTVSYPTLKSRRSIVNENFDYFISVAVPDSLTVVNGGKFIGVETNNGYSTYKYSNIKPAWRIDIAIAKYKTLENDKFKVFYFPEDSAGAYRFIKAFKEAKDLFSSWWGPLKNFEGLSVIEIPDGWGSQTDVTCIIQTAAAFKDMKESPQLYHEVSHLWYVPEKTEYPSRWNEGLAMLVQYLTVEKLEGKKVLQKEEEATINSLNKNYIKHPELKEIPISEFGEKNVTGLSYSAGMIMCGVLYKITGADNFHKTFGEFYGKYYEKGATLYDFIEIAGNISGKDLSEFINDWITTSNYTRFIADKMSVDEMAKKYK